MPLARTVPQSDTNVFGPLRLTQLVLPGCAGGAPDASSTSARWAAASCFPAAASITPAGTPVEALSDALRYELRPFGIAVVLIEPGLIKTSFAATVGAKLSALTTDAAADGDADAARAGDAAAVYADFNDIVARGTAAAYERGPMARMAGEPLDVARVIARAIEAPRPRARYTVAAVGHVLPDTAPLARRRRLGLVPAVQLRRAEAAPAAAG